MTWAKHYKKKKSGAKHIVKRITRRKEVAERNNVEQDRKTYDIAPEKYFRLCNGSEIKSIEELAKMMDRINDSDFSYHVNEEKNDFARWIQDVFGKTDLAKSLSSSKDKKEVQITLQQRYYVVVLHII